MQQAARNWADLGTQPAMARRFAKVIAAAFGSGRVKRPGHKFSPLDYLIESISCCPWTATAGSMVPFYADAIETRPPLYTAEERRRRDATAWTMVQGVLAPIQFAVFLVSLALVVNYLSTGQGYEVANASIIVKTGLLYSIMITGSIWEKRVFGRYLFARTFFYEDAVSMLVLALHTAYLVALIEGLWTDQERMALALAAYASYAVNAGQFLLKLRAARQEAPASESPDPAYGKTK